ncbi:hypothetical protein [Thermoactinomyces sp. DSM 45892]|uniref:hypothetical protein n=1 Tax=Thermoactinomyces sp. DSM 45892 TaxID=1882753 RepID=UPI00089CED8D|nr:hypothetical protein [Thermoactinomyces sp. DSM 45892]SDX95288.1 hypothetical protein SAMN05444416_10190 [Thermoactinomyces sp. DSM 45892]
MSEQMNVKQRESAMAFSHFDFAKLILNDVSKSNEGRSFLKKYTQSEVRELIEGYQLPKNQEKLREISRILWSKSGHYQRLIHYFAGMPLFPCVITPIKNIRLLNQDKVLKQYTQIGELLKMMNLKHEMAKGLQVAFREDAFFGYVHRDKKSFYIQLMPPEMCKITSIEDGCFNYSIDMKIFEKNETKLLSYANEIQQKYQAWKFLKKKNPRISEWVELDPTNTIAIKVNEEMIESLPPFVSVFDSVFDIDAFKKLRKDREEVGNYMAVSQQLPIRTDSENNNDFLIDKEYMTLFHNMIADHAPENVGVFTSPMKLDVLRFDKDKAGSDGVAEAQQNFWTASGISSLLFNSDKSTSQGLLMSIKTDEEIVFKLLVQIERWLNRFLKFLYRDLLFHVSILPVTIFNQQDMYKMYLEVSQYGVPIKNHLCATVGLSPIETMNMAYLENDLLELHDKFIPLLSSHTMSPDELKNEGRPPAESNEISDEGSRSQDKPNKSL